MPQTAEVVIAVSVGLGELSYPHRASHMLCCPLTAMNDKVRLLQLAVALGPMPATPHETNCVSLRLMPQALTRKGSEAMQRLQSTVLTCSQQV